MGRMRGGGSDRGRVAGFGLGITTGLCIMAFTIAYWLSCLFKLGPAERVSLMYGLGMNNNGTGLVLASLELASYLRVMGPDHCLQLGVQHLVAGSVHEVTSRNAGAQKPGGP